MTAHADPAGVVAIEVIPGEVDIIRRLMRCLQWGVGHLSLLAASPALASPGRDDPDLIATAQRLLATVVARSRFAAASRALTTELAHALQADRVSLGLVRRGAARVVALSHSAGDAKRYSLDRSLAACMDEAIDQRAILVWPAPPDDPNVALADQAHALREGSQAILTVPLYAPDRARGPHFTGAIVAERVHGPPFTQTDMALLDAATDLLAPVLHDKRLADRSFVGRLLSSLGDLLRAVFGPDWLLGKLIVVLVSTGLATAWAVFGPDRVIADARLEGAVQRAVTVAFAGYLASAPARPGDVVRQGDVLATLDDRDLLVERIRITAERREQRFQYERALADGDRPELRIARAQIEASDARLALIDSQLERTSLRAPLDGIVVSGDHSQRLQTAVAKGDVLFEVAPLDQYRLVLQVEEARLGDVVVGQDGQLTMVALPNQPLPISVERITPVAEARDGRTVFRVEAALVDPDPAVAQRLRPGMEGVARITVGEQPLLVIWTRSFVDWLRLALWRWTG